MSNAVRLKITLTDTEPSIWRRVEVPVSITLKDLHAVIQAAMGWENYHLYQFLVGRETVNGPGFEDVGFSGRRNLTAGRVTLDDLITSNTKRFGYLYDMGDSWEHELRIEKVLPADATTAYPCFLDGAGKCPPEDIGGLPGFYNFLEAIEDPDHPDHEELFDWYGGPFNPADVDNDAIKKRLARLAPRKKRKAA
ncbi:MAG TPA: plasmid pRiA4b ORF-3 family protein [Rhizomicrobium sp.]|nr:plasmid pRiA4b ORF-3 family protein [Rhizomicrobium sp.]